MPETKADKPKVCVFVSKEFARSFPNFERLFRAGVEEDTVIFDCISATDAGNYLNVVALNQSLPGRLPDANLWIPTRYVMAVLVHSDDRIQMGFPRSQHVEIDQDPDALLS